MKTIDDFMTTTDEDVQEYKKVHKDVSGGEELTDQEAFSHIYHLKSYSLLLMYLNYRLPELDPEFAKENDLPQPCVFSKEELESWFQFPIPEKIALKPLSKRFLKLKAAGILD